MKKIEIIGFMMLLLFAYNILSVYSEDPGFTVSGEITFKKQHAITVEIINKKEYDDNLPSIYSTIISLDEDAIELGKVSFSVTGVPAGKYIVKVYQDLNDNGKFDFSLVGGDPLGTYKKPGFTLGRPSFKKLSFTLGKDLSGITIKL